MKKARTRIYPVESLVHVVDGDTVDLLVDLGFYARMQVRFRLLGIDTPELKGATLAMGHDAAHVLEQLLLTAVEAEVESNGQADKYGPRWDGRIRVLPDSLGRLHTEWIDVGETLLRTGYAQPYTGEGARPTWDPRLPYPLRAAP